MFLLQSPEGARRLAAN